MVSEFRGERDAGRECPGCGQEIDTGCGEGHPGEVRTRRDEIRIFF